MTPTPLRTTCLLLTFLVAIALAPLASASPCTPYEARLDAPTGQHASLYTYSCDGGSYSSDDGSLRVEDDVTGQNAYLYGYQSEGSFAHGNGTNETTSSYESYGYGAGAYNEQGNLVPAFWLTRGEGSYSYNGSTYRWDYGQAQVSWGPFYQHLDLSILP